MAVSPCASRPERSGCRSNHSATYQQVGRTGTRAALLDVVHREGHQLIGVPIAAVLRNGDRVVEHHARAVVEVLGDLDQLAVDEHRVPVRVGLVVELGVSDAPEAMLTG